jgi:hypothetical protein
VGSVPDHAIDGVPTTWGADFESYCDAHGGAILKTGCQGFLAYQNAPAGAADESITYLYDGTTHALVAELTSSSFLFWRCTSNAPLTLDTAACFRFQGWANECTFGPAEEWSACTAPDAGGDAATHD